MPEDTVIRSVFRSAEYFDPTGLLLFWGSTSAVLFPIRIVEVAGVKTRWPIRPLHIPVAQFTAYFRCQLLQLLCLFRVDFSQVSFFGNVVSQIVKDRGKNNFRIHAGTKR